MLQLGTVFADRYEIRRLVGSGGMGAVYEARDRILDITVALKILQADSSAGAASRERFKRELLLARQVTHPNVLRIHDLGEADDVLFITMPMVAGSDLASILRRDGTIPTERTLAMGRQLIEGLAAAHEAGVIHRDLKPANIMVTPDDHVLIMDFGIARSLADETAPAVTAEGGVIGTVEYMAPEQATGAIVDERADIYAVGLILYDMLVGSRRVGKSGVAELMDRMQKAPPAPQSIDPSIPRNVNDAIMRSLSPDPARRHLHVRELLHDLDRLEAETRPQVVATVPRPWPRARWAAMAAALLVAGAIGTILWRGRPSNPSPASAAQQSVTLAILPFTSASSDPSLAPTSAVLEYLLSTELGQTAAIRAVPPGRVVQVTHDLRLDMTRTLASDDVNRIADLTNASHVLAGQINRLGPTIRVDATLRDIRGDRVTPISASAASDDDILRISTAVVEALRNELTRGAPEEAKNLQAASWRPTTISVTALKSYGEAMQFRQQGRHQDAAKKFDEATIADNRFALAFSGLAVSLAALGRQPDADTSSQRAVDLAAGLPQREKSLILANHYLLRGDLPRAVEAFETIARAEPANSSAHGDLAAVYEQSANYDGASAEYQRAAGLDPKNAELQLAIGRVALRRGRAVEALEPLSKAQALTIQLGNDEVRANVLQAIGIAYRQLGRLDDALKHYQDSLAIKERLGNKRGMAASFGEMALIFEQKALYGEAEQTHRKALAIQREMGDRNGVAVTLVNLAGLLIDELGRPQTALPMLRESLQIRRDTGNKDGEALALNAIGNAYLSSGDISEAQTFFQSALELRQRLKSTDRNVGDVMHNLATCLEKTGRYAEAIAYYHKGLDHYRALQFETGVAIETFSIGSVNDAEGKIGAALAAKKDGIDTARRIELRGFWLSELLQGYAHTLNFAGRPAEAEPLLAEALKIATELDHPSLLTRIHISRTEAALNANDFKGASVFAGDAMAMSNQTPDKHAQLSARVIAQVVAARANPSRAAAERLEALSRDANRAAWRPIADRAAVESAHALALVGGARDLAAVDRIVATIDDASGRWLKARARFARAQLRSRVGAAGSADDLAVACGLWREIAGEPGVSALLQRLDVAPAYALCGAGGSHPR